MMSIFTAAAALLSICSFTLAQSSVPSDLSSSFDPTSITLQVLYPALEKVDLHGFSDGAEVSQKDADQQPSFALGDSSGVNPSLTMLIVLLDTTSPSERMLHFMQTGFRANQDATAISSSDAPLVPYDAPGTLEEPAGKRQYSWLAFQQPKSFKTTGQFGAGDFNVQDFMQANNLQNPIAGVAMTVQVSDLTGGQQAPPSQPTQQPQQTQPEQPAAPTTQAPAQAPSATLVSAPLMTINPVSTTSSAAASFSSSTSESDTPSAAATSSMSSMMSMSSSAAATTMSQVAVTSTTFVRPSSTTSAGSSVSSAAADALRRNVASFAALPVALAVGLLV